MVALLLALASVACAGGGPENVLLVVNPESPASLAIANHYAALRHVPSGNVLYLPWDPKAQTTDIDTFRKQVLAPVVGAVGHSRGQIDCVAYSSDFPWAVQLDADVKRLAAAAEKEAAEAEAKSGERSDAGAAPRAKPRFAVPGQFKPVGSLTGLTYLCEGVMTGNPQVYSDLRSNWYMRRQVPEQKDAPSLAFKSSDCFGPHGELVKPDSGGRRYLLSVMLGVTAGRGNSMDEAINYLRRSASADGAHPAGTIYYVQNSDIRSRVRQGGYPEAVRELKALGVAAEIVEGVMPMEEKDVQGAMLGTASFDWKTSKSTILPGAICEHFTSFGGVMSAGGGQTPLSEFLRYGAAGASGTVTEPYAIADKFPSPMLHVHYARGCTLAEAFYQSVFGPYQLLIVGDPFCRPWANIPKVTVSGIAPGASVRGVMRLQPAAQFAGKSTIDHFELFLDGSRVHQSAPGRSLELDTAKLADGYHELRVVAVEAGPIASQGEVIVPVMTANHGLEIDVHVEPPTAIRLDQSLTLKVSAPGCSTIGVAQGTRWVGKAEGEQGTVTIKASLLGEGPVRLQVVGTGKSGNVLAKPLDLAVQKGA
jgi:hypothetical protein